MLKKFLKDSVSMIVGKQFENIVDFIDSEKYTNEFLIAKKLDVTINQTRNILYKLSDNGLVSSIRKKDKKKGWYTYSWRIEALKTLDFLKDSINKKISQVRNQIESREVKRFYFCERCNIECSEENALLRDFTCSECGNVFSVKDNSKVIKELRRNLEKQKTEISLLEKEINELREKEEKKKFRETKKLEKIKQKERERARQARKKAAPKNKAKVAKKIKKNKIKIKNKKSGKVNQKKMKIKKKTKTSGKMKKISKKKTKGKIMKKKTVKKKKK